MLQTPTNTPTLAPKQIHIETPLLPSPEWAQKLGVAHVFLKMDNEQPGQSFKIRGIGTLINKHRAHNPQLRAVVSSSGGNAGMAATIAGRAHNLAVHVFMPSIIPEFMKLKLQEAGATVVVAGASWDEAHMRAISHVNQIDQEYGVGSALLVHPFEGRTLWEGHSTMISEIKHQLPGGVVPDVIVCAVGGGGLLSGIIWGCMREWGGGMPDVDETGLPVDILAEQDLAATTKIRTPIIVAAETVGAESFFHALKTPDEPPSPLPSGKITSLATSLGALTVTPAALHFSRLYGNKVRSCLVTDTEAVKAVVDFQAKGLGLVEVACGAALAVAADDHLQKVVPELTKDSVVVLIVCGGGVVTQEKFEEWIGKTSS
ncbi:tryptophan synthase beta subunit-like PLP-dependent enzyme [Phlyctochytrium arcticum]|nr:tryptophan synthase beta subunit-like PLP-dependent enzyme [Phlyctochytrium arcticum]